MDINSAMIIDDSEGDQFLAKMQIAEFDPDIEIYQAFDGQEALEKLSKLEKQPNVIFLDINMPRMDGLEFLQYYDQRQKTGTVVVMLTSSDQAKDKDSAMKYGCVKQYFMKLLDGADLAVLQSM